MVMVTLPIDCPEVSDVGTHLTIVFYVLFMSFNYVSSLIPVLALRIYRDIIVTNIIYNKEVTNELIKRSFLFMLIAMLNHTIIYLLLSWIGQLYVKNEVSRVNNELILDNLDDGLIIIEEQSGELVF